MYPPEPACRWIALARGLRFPALACLAVLAASPQARAASLVIEADSGLVLHADQATRPWFPASLTKIMTAYLVFEALGKDQFELSSKLPVSAAAAGQAPTKLGLREGAMITVDEALSALAVRSANDVAVVLAEALAHSEEGFAIMMTAKARALGMRGTVFRNASGLPNPNQRSTARDLAILARALIKDFPGGYGYFGRQSASFRGRSYSSTNRWAASFEGADGIKTGFTCASGFNLAASAERGGRRLIAILLGAKSSALRNISVTKLLSRGFETLGSGRSELGLIGDLKPSAVPGAEPPHILSAKACGAHVGKPAEVALSGWGIIFGSFRDKATAGKLARERRHLLKSVIDRGRIAVVPRQRDGFVGFSALIVGLKPEEAGRACKHLWSLKAYCLSLAPKVLQNPNALWR